MDKKSKIQFSISSTGYELFFQQSKITLTVPIFDSTTNNLILDKNSLIKLKVVDLNSSAGGNATFKLENDFNFLKLEKSTGQLWFIRDKFKGFRDGESEKIIDNVVVTAENEIGDSAELSIVLRVKKFNDLNSFCMTKDLCFYDQITHHILEDVSEEFLRPREIGELSPKIYSKLCKVFNISYHQLNGKVKISSISTNDIKTLLNYLSLLLNSNAICRHQK